MKQPFSHLHILWAIDPFEPAGTIHKLTGRMLGSILSRKQAKITPVSVQSMPQELPPKAMSQWRGQFMKVFQDAISLWLRELRIKGAQPPVILPSNAVLVLDRVHELISYSRRTKSDLIVITSQKKMGLKKLFDDSFSETLFYQSKIPVLVFGSRIRSLRPLNHILFPTDFSAKSGPLFGEVVQFASQMKARITLFHAIKTENNVELPSLSFREREKSQEVKKNMRRIHSTAQRWVEEAKNAGVEVTLSVIHTQNEVPSEMIKVVRRENISMIAMQDKSSWMSATVIGSNTRQTVRTAPCPVLVLKVGKKVSKRNTQRRVLNRAA